MFILPLLPIKRLFIHYIIEGYLNLLWKIRIFIDLNWQNETKIKFFSWTHTRFRVENPSNGPDEFLLNNLRQLPMLLGNRLSLVKAAFDDHIFSGCSIGFSASQLKGIGKWKNNPGWLLPRRRSGARESTGKEVAQKSRCIRIQPTDSERRGVRRNGFQFSFAHSLFEVIREIQKCCGVWKVSDKSSRVSGNVSRSHI